MTRKEKHSRTMRKRAMLAQVLLNLILGFGMLTTYWLASLQYI